MLLLNRIFKLMLLEWSNFEQIIVCGANLLHSLFDKTNSEVVVLTDGHQLVS